MAVIESFQNPKDKEICEEFVSQGYVIRDVENPEALDSLRQHVLELICENLKTQNLNYEPPKDTPEFLNNIHKIVPVEKLNDIRFPTYQKMNLAPWFRPTYYALGQEALAAIVGNELAMQNRVNLSVQMPEDNSSLISIHADSFSGETPFQVVQWLPLVDAYETKSMFYLPPEKHEEFLPRLKNIAQESDSPDPIYDAVKNDVHWINVPYGKVVIFNSNVFHGNIVNKTSETRWSLNARCTGLFTPYATSEKGLGNFYLPITLKPMSKIGMKYSSPPGFEE